LLTSSRTEAHVDANGLSPTGSVLLTVTLLLLRDRLLGDWSICRLCWQQILLQVSGYQQDGVFGTSIEIRVRQDVVELKKFACFQRSPIATEHESVLGVESQGQDCAMRGLSFHQSALNGFRRKVDPHASQEYRAVDMETKCSTRPDDVETHLRRNAHAIVGCMHVGPTADFVAKRRISENFSRYRDGIELEFVLSLARLRNFALMHEDVKSDVLMFDVQCDTEILPEAVALKDLLPAPILELS